MTPWTGSISDNDDDNASYSVDDERKSHDLKILYL